MGAAAQVAREAQHRVGAVAVIVDELLAHDRRAWRLGRAQRQARQRVGGDLRVLRLYLAPGDRAVLVAVETEREIEIAQRDVPLAVDGLAVDVEREIAVRRLVRQRRAVQQHSASEQRRATPCSVRFIWRRPLRGFTNAATAGYSRPVASSHWRTVSSAARIAGRMRRLGEDAQVGGFALDVPVFLGEAQRELRSRR